MQSRRVGAPRISTALHVIFVKSYIWELIPEKMAKCRVSHDLTTISYNVIMSSFIIIIEVMPSEKYYLMIIQE